MSTREIIYAAAGASGPATYIEDVFSTWLYTGTGANLTINNGIDLAGKGGMTWFKGRNTATSHALFDTNRGAGYSIYSNATSAQSYFIDDLSSFTSTGFTLGDSATSGRTNASGYNYCSWTFRKQPKFFDVVTYTGDGVAGRTISHNLGSVPGMIIVKKLSNADNWGVYHRSLGATQRILLNSTGAAGANSGYWNDTAPTSTVFTVGSGLVTNESGETYVAYLFAHDAGGFGLTGADNVISCGSFVADGGGGCNVTLGYEPQWILYKRTGTDSWNIADVMRGWSQTQFDPLFPNLASGETNLDNTPSYLSPTATGFTSPTPGLFIAGSTYIYMAIRRGPMATPTTATTVFNPVYGQSGAPGFRSSNFNAGVDTSFVFLTSGYNDGTNAYQNIQTRLTGFGQVQTGNTRAEVSQSYNTWDYMNGQNNSTFYSAPWGSWLFRRAPGFHDVVCFNGSSSSGSLTHNHNLGVAPELIITKYRDRTAGWYVYASPLGNTKYLELNTTAASGTSSGAWNNTTPSSTTFTTGNFYQNGAPNAAVAYLFATVAGVSKVGSYTGTGSTLNINAGLPTGARFVLIKRTDSTGDWWVWDTTRGMVAGTNPRLALNNYNAEINNNWVYTVTNGFQIVTTDATVNASGGTYIYLAIA